MFHVNAETFLPVIGVIFALLICSVAYMRVKYRLRHEYNKAERKDAARTAEKLHKAGVDNSVIIAVLSTKDVRSDDVIYPKLSDKGNTKE